MEDNEIMDRKIGLSRCLPISVDAWRANCPSIIPNRSTITNEMLWPGRIAETATTTIRLA
jgi:hypothetical protein